MVSKYYDKNKFGGYTWKIKIDNLFHIYICGTDNSSFVVEFKEWKWINFKTHFTYVSNKDLKNTIIETFEKVYDFFLSYKDFIWTNQQKIQKLDIVLKQFEKLNDIPTVEKENIEVSELGTLPIWDKPEKEFTHFSKLRIELEETNFGFGNSANEFTSSTERDLTEKYDDNDFATAMHEGFSTTAEGCVEFFETKKDSFAMHEARMLFNSGNLGGAIDSLEVYTNKYGENLSVLIMLARFRILTKDKIEAKKIVQKILGIMLTKIGFITKMETEEFDIVMKEYEKLL